MTGSSPSQEPSRRSFTTPKPSASPDSGGGPPRLIEATPRSLTELAKQRSPSELIIECASPDQVVALLNATLLGDDYVMFSEELLDECLELLEKGGEIPDEVCEKLMPEEGTLLLCIAEVVNISPSGLKRMTELRFSIQENCLDLPWVAVSSGPHGLKVRISWKESLQHLSAALSDARWAQFEMLAEMVCELGENVPVTSVETNEEGELLSTIGPRVSCRSIARCFSSQELEDDPHPSVRLEFIDLCASDGWCQQDGEPVPLATRALSLHSAVVHLLQRDIRVPKYEDLRITREELLQIGEGRVSQALDPVQIRACEEMLLIVGPLSTGRSLLEDLDALRARSIALDQAHGAFEEFEIGELEVLDPCKKEFAAAAEMLGIEGAECAFMNLAAFAQEGTPLDEETYQDLLIDIARRRGVCALEFLREFELWQESEDLGSNHDEISESETGFNVEEEDGEEESGESHVLENWRVTIRPGASEGLSKGPVIELCQFVPRQAEGEEGEDLMHGEEISPSDQGYLVMQLYHRAGAQDGYSLMALSRERLDWYLKAMGLGMTPDVLSRIEYEDDAPQRYALIAPKVRLNLL